jgi:RNA polymerase sigma-70 factor (ECF subfamily)
VPKIHRESEIELARLLSAGRMEFFETFARSFGSRLLKYSLLLCRSHADAEEVVQDALLMAYQGFRDLREPAGVHAWFFRIARNACLRKRRRSIFAPATELSLDELCSLSSEATQFPDCSAAPDDKLLRSESEAALTLAISELPENQRMTVILRYFEGLSIEETAHALDLTPEVVKARLYRARLAMRKKLEALTPA